MAYALLQKQLAAVAPEPLKKAFRVLPAYTELDAHNAAHDAFGILKQGLDLEAASLLQDALMRDGIDTEVVEETDLPVIPPAKVIKQMEFLPAHLSLYDPLGRSFNLAWSEIMMMAAGSVRMPDFRKNKPQEPPLPGNGYGPDPQGLVAKEAAQFHLVLEVVLLGGVSRFSVLADDFVFDHLGVRVTNQVSRNFKLLVQDLIQSAPHAGLNRGAYLIAENDVDILTYSSKTAFYNELVWMLWRIQRAAAGG